MGVLHNIQIEGAVTLNLYGGKFYKSGDKSGSSSSIWERKGGQGGGKGGFRDGGHKKSCLSNLKSTFFTPIGTGSGYKRSKALQRKFSPERDQNVKRVCLVLP